MIIMPSLRELMQISMEPFDSQPTGEVVSSNEHYIHFLDTDGTSNQPMWVKPVGSLNMNKRPGLPV